MKKNPIHSFLYKEYKKHVKQINKYLLEITQYKSFLSQRSNNDYANEQTHKALKQTREKLKYHQHISRYLKYEILYHNNLTEDKRIYYHRHVPIPNPYNTKPTKQNKIKK